METRPLTGQAKLKDVTALLATLKDDLRITNLSEEQRRAAFERLKIYGRAPRDAEPIFTKEGIEILTKHGVTEDSSPSSLEALRCLANAMLLELNTRQIFVDLGWSGRISERLKIQDSDNEFVISRILFLATYETNLNFDPLFENHALGESINSHIARHAKQFTKGGETNRATPIDQAALSESLKLLFNLSTYYPNRIKTFTPSIKNIFDILNNMSIPNPPLQPPINYLVNALVNLDLEAHPTSTNTPITPLITILSRSLHSSPSTPPNPSQLAPLLTLLRKIYQISPSPQKTHLESLLLPSPTDRDLPLGKSDTLPSRLLRLTTAPTAAMGGLGDDVAGLLFELSGGNGDRFARNVGYGYAVGYLVRHGIPISTSRSEAQLPMGGEGGAGGGAEEPVNPVTGQKLSKEEEEEDQQGPRADSGPDMTEAEKEREAERLFVLFERLRATGVVDVGNPLREAVERGTFENGKARVEEVEDD